MEQRYQVKTEAFEGPLGLLLNLIEKRKLFINDVSLAQIADDYIAYIRNANNFSINDSSDFIFVASTLMLIKSKSLLPTLNLTLEEEASIDDLEKRLKIYQRIRDLSVFVNERFGKQIIFPKSEIKNKEIIFSPDKQITAQNIFSLAVGMIMKLPKKEMVPKRSIKKIISLEEMIDRLTQRIKTSMKMSFKEFSGMGKTERVNVVVSFLAMLELFKQGIISIKQTVNFGEIDMENKDIKVPHY
ncbi:segregation/condensation protein A [Patescibacteria group bacterium]|nr:segregation/condensation protein A [Patescibacteria group bacterium]MCG2695222.1 segregation/condensation protein A [Candidatus Parcubacteria bacterium]